MELTWDQTGARLFETGVDHGVLYKPNAQGVYETGVAWNGLTTVTESPSGAETSAQYADNIKYLNLQSAEEFGFTIEAFTYPDEFEECDGSAQPAPGVYFQQQTRKSFGFSYRTLVGNDLEGTDHGYKLHLVYNALAAPSEKARATVNEQTEPLGLSWECSTTPVSVGVVAGVRYKPLAHLVIDSTKVDASDLADLEDALYGTAGTDPRLPSPAEVVAFFNTVLVSVTPVAPTYNSTTHVVTIPTTTGVDYKIGGVKKTGAVPITGNTVVTASPQAGYKLAANVVDEFGVTY